jgi:hypothetical protein
MKEEGKYNCEYEQRLELQCTSLESLIIIFAGVREGNLCVPVRRASEEMSPSEKDDERQKMNSCFSGG